MASVPGQVRVTWPDGRTTVETLLDRDIAVGSKLAVLNVDEEDWLVAEVHGSDDPDLLYDVRVERA